MAEPSELSTPLLSASDLYQVSTAHSEEYLEGQKVVTNKSFGIIFSSLIDTLRPSHEVYAMLLVDLITKHAPYIGKCDIDIALEICNSHSGHYYLNLGAAENIDIGYLGNQLLRMEQICDRRLILGKSKVSVQNISVSENEKVKSRQNLRNR